MSSFGTPTLIPADPFIPQADAEALRNAMKGFGCDTNALIEVLCRRTNSQRVEIVKSFKTSFGKDLIAELKSETSGNLTKLLVALCTPTLNFYCNEIRGAIAGIGTDEEVLIETLCTLPNDAIKCINYRYKQIHCKDLESDIIGDTSGHFRKLLVSLCNANRDDGCSTDVNAAKADAAALLEAGEDRFGTDESIFNMILCQRNYRQLRMVFKEYHNLTGHTLEDAIKSEFSGDIEKGLVAIYRCVNSKAEFFAHQLMKSMKGLGTNDRQLIRLVINRSETDMVEIKQAFQRLFNGSLAEWINDDTSGAYRDALLILIGDK